MTVQKEERRDGAAAVLAMLQLAQERSDAALAGGAVARTLYSREAEAPVPEAPEELPELTAEELLAECRLEPETDIGNARRFIIRYGNRVLNVARIGWHGYDGRRWKEDEDGSIVRPLAQKTAEFILDEAYGLGASDEERAAIDAGEIARKELKALGRATKEWDVEKTEKAEALQRRIELMEGAKEAVGGRMSSRFRHAKSSAGTSKINNMMTEAIPHVAKMVNDLNRDLLAVNCQSGTLRFYEEEDEESDPEDPRFMWRVRLDPHRQADLITKLMPVKFRSGGKPQIPQFDKFLKTVMPDPDIRAFLKRFVGYCLTGRTDEQCLLFFYGAGRNGKSTLVDLLCQLFGDFAVTLSIDSFAGESRRGGAEATPDLARLPGARFVAASEPEMGVKLKDALIKTVTGGEAIPVRRLHQDFFEVVPQFKIILSGNHKPVIHDTSDGIWRRVHLVPFEIQIPREDVDRALPAKLRAELSEIFLWAIEGALEYLNYGLAPPARVTEATREYREESDPIGAFIRGACVVTGKEEDVASPGDLHLGYSNWASKEGAAEFRQVTFSRRFPDYARKTWEGPDGKMHTFWKAKAGTTVYRGIIVRDEFLMPGRINRDESDR
ncbi:phage/plasmid primase, P4 family [Antarcticirhabdus aurantiaca]|uniref:Phage/plasmid primase, P4 family n=1 Tax=Antarcticirhabdus aurantiaca TaxID=2606717 RepID=A0ACD4NRH8_9HYPH|nr:phage/plasmid primase, P4 family [Jeongeuplla avenae]